MPMFSKRGTDTQPSDIAFASVSDTERRAQELKKRHQAAASAVKVCGERSDWRGLTNTKCSQEHC